MSEVPRTRFQRFARTRLERDVSAVTGIAVFGAACGAALLTLTGLVLSGLFALPQGDSMRYEVAGGKGDGGPRVTADGARTAREENSARGNRHWPSWRDIEDTLPGHAIRDDAVLRALLTRGWESASSDAARQLRCAGPALLQALDGAHYGWSECAEVAEPTPTPTPTPVAGRKPIVVPAWPALARLARQWGGEVALVNLHGASVERATDDPARASESASGSSMHATATALRGNRGRRFTAGHTGGWPTDAQWPSLRHDTEAVQRVDVDGERYWQTAVPLAGPDARQIGWLVWRTGGAALATRAQVFSPGAPASLSSPPGTPPMHPSSLSASAVPSQYGLDALRRRIGARDTDHAHGGESFSGLLVLALVGVLIVASILLCIVVLRCSFSVIFAPLRRAMSDLRRLADGHIAFQPDDADRDRDDEAGAIVRAAITLRADLLARHALRDERARSVARQGQLMRAQLRTLAVTLDETDRIRIGETLDALQAPSDSLVDLAGVLTHMTGLVCGQHERLRGLLAEREAALVREVQFAALHQELLIARQMQMSILPQTLPSACDAAGLALASTILPAREVGGDFYDYFMLDDRHVAIVIADVSGKGVPAAFFMAVARALLKNTAGMMREPAAVMTRLNALLCEDNAQCMFVTMFFGVLDLRTSTFDYVNAGHNCPLRLHRDNPDGAEWIDRARGIALGVLPDAQYTQHREILDRDDIVFFYTDGVTEACDREDALFGEAALRDTVVAVVAAMDGEPVDALATTRGMSCVPDLVAVSQRPDTHVGRRITDAVMAAVQVFADGAPQADDITCVALTWVLPQVRKGTP